MMPMYLYVLHRVFYTVSPAPTCRSCHVVDQRIGLLVRADHVDKIKPVFSLTDDRLNRCKCCKSLTQLEKDRFHYEYPPLAATARGGLVVHPAGCFSSLSSHSDPPVTLSCARCHCLRWGGFRRGWGGLSAGGLGYFWDKISMVIPNQRLEHSLFRPNETLLEPQNQRRATQP